MTTPTRKAARKSYGIVRGYYSGIHGGALAIQAISGPYTVLEEGLVDPRAAVARARELEAAENPTGDRATGVHVFSTSRAGDYKPLPERYSTYEVRAFYSRRAEPLEVELRDVRRKPSAVKDFRDYVKRIRTREAGDGATARRVYGRLVRAELVRRDFYKGKPAGLEVVLTDADLRP